MPPKKAPIKWNGAYFCSHNFLILKLLEIAFTLIALIMAVQFEGDGRLIFIAIVMALALVTFLAWVLLFCMNLNGRFPEFFPILMMACHITLALLTIGGTICAALLWPEFKLPYYIICTICSFIASVLFAVDAVLNLLWWRGAVDEIMTCPCSPWEADLNLG